MKENKGEAHRVRFDPSSGTEHHGLGGQATKCPRLGVPDAWCGASSVSLSLYGGNSWIRDGVRSPAVRAIRGPLAPADAFSARERNNDNEFLGQRRSSSTPSWRHIQVKS